VTRLLRKLVVAGVFASSAFALAPSASAVCWHTHDDGTIEFHLNDADCQTPNPPPPAGQRCGHSSASDPGTEGGDVQSGEVHGGPMVVHDGHGNPGQGTMHCNTQTGGGRHSDPDNGASASASGTGVIVLPPTLISYNAPPGVPVYLCTSFTYANGQTLYWDDSNDPAVSGRWTTDPNADCALTIEAGTGDLDPVIGPIDAFDCPVLATLGTALPDMPGVVEIDDEGDVALAGSKLQDCPPYGG
jgi:hypothetical protein